jgi:DNA primase
VAFSPAFLDELRRRLSIFDLVGKKVRLNRRGKQATGLCPFHNEKSPSFHVYDDDEPHYHCFGCGAHGDAITFVMQTDGLDFRDAVERLSGEAGLEVPKDTPQDRERAERQASLGTVMEASCTYFQQQLAGSPGAGYFQRRGLTSETINRFRLGFAADSRVALKNHLAKLNIPEALSIEAGMLIKPEDGSPTYDRFRNRVIFPIADTKGRIVAFGGRVLGDEKPKYLNSPETPLFSKGRQLYNMNFAQKAARETSEVIVVEGYMDVIALAQAGFPQVVAPLGTALTEEQIEVLWRLAPEPILCFDGDEAGQKAAAKVAERVLPILKPGLSLNFINLVNEESGGKEDPDSFLKKHSAAEFRTYLDARKTPLSGILWTILRKERLLDTPERRAGFRSDINHLTNLITDKATREEYRGHFQGMLQQISGGEVGGARMAPGQRRQQRSFGVTDAGRTGADGRNYSFFDWRFLPQFYKEFGGEALLQGWHSVRRLPVEAFLVTVLHHPDLLHKYIENLKALEIGDTQLAKFRNRLVRIAIEVHDLTGTGLWSQLVQEGFGDFLATLSFRTHALRFTLPIAEEGAAEAGLLHVLGILHEHDLRAERDSAGKLWAEDPSEDNWRRFETLRDLLLEAESRRRDLDPVFDTPARGVH